MADNILITRIYGYKWDEDTELVMGMVNFDRPLGWCLGNRLLLGRGRFWLAFIFCCRVKAVALDLSALCWADCQLCALVSRLADSVSPWPPATGSVCKAR